MIKPHCELMNLMNDEEGMFVFLTTPSSSSTKVVTRDYKSSRLQLVVRFVDPASRQAVTLAYKHKKTKKKKSKSFQCKKKNYNERTVKLYRTKKKKI